MCDRAADVVIDLGTASIKSGFSSEPHPKLDTPTVPGAIEGGVVSDWSKFENQLSSIYNELNVKSDSFNLLLTDNILWTNKIREKLLEVMFEKFDVPRFQLTNQGVLPLYSTSRTTGLVVDVGEGVAQVTPIYDGFPIPDARRVTRKPTGASINRKLIQMVTVDDLNIIREIKQRMCYIRVANDICHSEQDSFEIPDGSGGVRMLGKSDADWTEPTEVLFDSDDSHSLQNIIMAAVKSCDVDIRKQMYGNIVLCGGTTLTPGFELRLADELSKLTPSSVNIKIEAVKERKYLVWIGGSIMAGLNTFQDMWIDRKAYQDIGMTALIKNLKS